MWSGDGAPPGARRRSAITATRSHGIWNACQSETVEPATSGEEGDHDQKGDQASTARRRWRRFVGQGGRSSKRPTRSPCVLADIAASSRSLNSRLVEPAVGEMAGELVGHLVAFGIRNAQVGGGGDAVQRAASGRRRIMCPFGRFGEVSSAGTRYRRRSIDAAGSADSFTGQQLLRYGLLGTLLRE